MKPLSAMLRITGRRKEVRLRSGREYMTDVVPLFARKNGIDTHSFDPRLIERNQQDVGSHMFLRSNSP